MTVLNGVKNYNQHGFIIFVGEATDWWILVLISHQQESDWQVSNSTGHCNPKSTHKSQYP
jgi:hypothetical protein